MSIAHCTAEDISIIGEALRAAADGPYFPDWEFDTLFGLTRARVAEISRAWPNVDMSDADVDLAVNNAIANLVGYPQGKESDRGRFSSLLSSPLLEVLERWRLSKRGHRRT